MIVEKELPLERTMEHYDERISKVDESGIMTLSYWAGLRDA